MINLGSNTKNELKFARKGIATDVCRKINVFFKDMVDQELRKLGTMGNMTFRKKIPVDIGELKSPIRIIFLSFDHQ